MSLQDTLDSLRTGALALNPAVSAPQEPILTQLPNIVTSLDTKYADPAVQGLPEPELRTLADIDLRRAQRNQMPTGPEETARIVQSIRSGDLVTEKPKRRGRNLLGNFLSDIKAMTLGLPKLPVQVLKQVQEVPNIPNYLSNPEDKRNIVAKLASAPGVNLVPGSYIVEQLASGNPGELLRHPGFTLADAMPLASKAAAGTKVARAAEATALPGVRSRPLRTVLTRTLDEAGQVVPNRLGRATEAIAETRPGQMWKAAFGKEARRLAFLEHTGHMDLVTSLNPAFDRNISSVSRPERIAWAREAVNLANEHADIPKARIAEITRDIQLGDYTKLTDREINFVARARELADMPGQWGVEDGFLGMVDGEYYPIRQAQLILGRRTRHLTGQTLAASREAAAGIDPADAIPKLRELAKMPTSKNAQLGMAKLNTTDRYRAVSGYLHGLDVRGYDVDALSIVWREANRKAGKNTMSDFFRELDDFERAPGVRTLPVDPTAILPDLRKLGRTDPQVRLLVDHIQNGRMGPASQVARALSRRTKFRVAAVDDYIDALARQSRRDSYLRRMDKSYDLKDTTLARNLESYERATKRYAPARWQPLINKRVGEEVAAMSEEARQLGFDGLVSADDLKAARENYVKQNGSEFVSQPDPENVARIVQAVTENRYAEYVDYGTLRDIQDDITAQWTKMRDDGLDPAFVHRISPEQVRGLQHPRVSEVARIPGSTRVRSVDFTPGYQDLTIALTHDMMSYLARDISEYMADSIRRAFGKTRQELVDKFMPMAEEWAARDPSAPSVTQRLEELIGKNWQAFDPKSLGINWSNERLNLMKSEQIYIPKYLAENIQRMHAPKIGKIGALTDPVTSTFRTAVLPFSPRWHFNNVFGNTVMALARTDPRILLHARQAWEWAKNPEKAPEALYHTFGGEVGMLREFDYDSARNVANFAGGKTMGRLFRQAQESKIAAGVAKARDASYTFNQTIDNFFRGMVYEYATKTKGASPVGAIELARNIFPQFYEMTPIERQIIRSVFPFYGFTQHIIRYAMRYPADHPVRTAILGSVARGELEDLGTGLPEQFMGMFFFGKGSVPGAQRAISTASFNPFGQVADIFTISGFLSGANPILSTALEQVGIVSGGPELYPDLHYNAQTGRLEATQSNPLLSLISNTIPQTDIITSLLGMNADFNDKLRSDPAAAIRMLATRGGLPLVYRQIDTAGTIARNEQTVYDAQQQAFRDALRSGDYGAASRWPGLQGQLQAVQALQQSGGAVPFQPSSIPTRASLTSGI